MKLLIIAVVAWIAGLAELFLPFCFAGGELDLTMRSSPDVGSLVSAALFFALFNTPGLYWLRLQMCERTERSLNLSPAFALILNAPVFLLAAFLAGRTLPADSALLFISTLVIVSIAFGLGFAWSLPKQ